jgi:hypothetical protein
MTVAEPSSGSWIRCCKDSGSGPSGICLATVAVMCRRMPMIAPAGSRSSTTLPMATSIQAVRQPHTAAVR